jgi:hypothetical protein
MFHDLNDLVIVFNVSNKDKLTNGLNVTTTLNKTKRIYINSSSFKKTKRNLFKDNIP